MKRIALLLFAGLFGFATLQTATAQTEDYEDSHDVNIDVETINTISANGSPTISVTSTDDFEGWIEDDGDGSYSVTTNDGKSHKVKVKVDGNSVTEDNLDGFRVTVNEKPGGSSYKDGSTISLMDGDDFKTSNQEIITGVKNVSADGLGLTYEAQIGPEFSSDEDGDITVMYTLEEK